VCTAENSSEPDNRNSIRRILSDEVLSILRESAQNFFAERLAPLINDLIDKLEPRQKDGVGISLAEIECREWATRYSGVVRRTAGHFCKELAQAVGSRRGLGDEEKLWIRAEVEQFVNQKISRQAAQDFFGHAISTYYLIENQHEVETAFCDALTHAVAHTRFVMLMADRALDHAAALYPPILTSPEPVAYGSPEPSRITEAGRFCAAVISELRRIRHSYPASNTIQIRVQNPDFMVWQMFENSVFDDEDRDIFGHPNRWGPTVTYGYGRLAKYYGKSEDTIKRWAKLYGKHAGTQA
jgi:hypothetical protein